MLKSVYLKRDLCVIQHTGAQKFPEVVEKSAVQHSACMPAGKLFPRGNQKTSISRQHNKEFANDIWHCARQLNTESRQLLLMSVKLRTGAQKSAELAGRMTTIHCHHPVQLEKMLHVLADNVR